MGFAMVCCGVRTRGSDVLWAFLANCRRRPTHLICVPFSIQTIQLFPINPVAVLYNPGTTPPHDIVGIGFGKGVGFGWHVPLWVHGMTNNSPA